MTEPHTSERVFTLREAELRARYGVPLDYLGAHTFGLGGKPLGRSLKIAIKAIQQTQDRIDSDLVGAIPRLALVGDEYGVSRDPFLRARTKNGELACLLKPEM
jgi:hypothetical protein